MCLYKDTFPINKCSIGVVYQTHSEPCGPRAAYVGHIHPSTKSRALLELNPNCNFNSETVTTLGSCNSDVKLRYTEIIVFI